MNLKAADRQRQILLAAAECFARKGFHQTTMDDIAREAGISAGLIYRHFAGKEELIIELVKTNTRVQQTKLDQARQYKDFAQTIEAFFDIGDDIIDWHTRSVLLVEVVAESLRNKRVADVVVQDDIDFIHEFAALITQAQSQGQIDPSLAPLETAELLVALTEGMLLRLSLASEDDDFDEATFNKTLKTLYTRFLGLKPATGEAA
ncbi:MAG: TetR/AcrR family transcriptional regulator [Chloroflexi bacterium AL-W]|nr:TetR/AcrR family transcriptional regulator [Chloroflexi bacterium AL-N1]NOK69573.1 TetR/AcrR family transcriptional regulator [Chloroflexi bacterium AL-N10]NOK77538.1 TetR/AcrR family transcriptional regulator [Chloroflexi bacterium AL-N5]NOK84389.1 TetR/AcrR family transcriptional regulator [Chloroflexi bacterium AL-W]NOK91445.1 TetR/AcrR family transcriptional regulator [Chloroflexi bacterium AL-N15]